MANNIRPNGFSSTISANQIVNQSNIQNKQISNVNASSATALQIQPKKLKRRRPVYIDESLCVFCNNSNVNYLEETFKFFTAKACGHKVCQVCFQSEAFAAREIPCPACGSILKKTQISEKSWEELEYEREKDIRVDISKEFNLNKEDFKGDAAKYDEYLELKATVIYNLYHRKDLEWTQEKRKENLRLYGQVIARNATSNLENDKLFSLKLQQEAIKEIEWLHSTEESEKKARLDRVKDEVEANLVKLGELSESSTARAKKEKVNEESKMKLERLKEYEGLFSQKEQKAALKNVSLFWSKAQQLQPRPVDSSNDPAAKIKKEKPDKITVAIAGGYNFQEVDKKTNELMKALLFDLQALKVETKKEA